LGIEFASTPWCDSRQTLAMESLAFTTSAAVAPNFCAQGCVKCSPASLSLRSSSLSSSSRSECSSSSQFHGSHLRPAQTPTPRPTKQPLIRAVFLDESEKANNSSEKQVHNPNQPINGHAPSPQNPPPPSDIDELWLTIRSEARVESEKEPALASHFYSSVISHRYGMLIIKILAHMEQLLTCMQVFFSSFPIHICGEAKLAT
jgi:hypothetical protein